MSRAGHLRTSKRNPVKVRGPWLPMPIEFLRSRACAELSPHAVKLLVDLCAALGPNAKGNGDLSAALTVMRPKGWTSIATLRAALSELAEASLLTVTRHGDRGKCTLYAVTLWPLDCDLAKLDHGPGSFSTLDWERHRPCQAQPPTAKAPARWHALRKNEKTCPAAGASKGKLDPSRYQGIDFD